MAGGLCTPTHASHTPPSRSRRETTTLGVRHTRVARHALPRRFVTAKTRYGDVSVKLGLLGGRVVTVHPEVRFGRESARRAGGREHTERDEPEEGQSVSAGERIGSGEHTERDKTERQSVSAGERAARVRASAARAGGVRPSATSGGAVWSIGVERSTAASRLRVAAERIDSNIESNRPRAAAGRASVLRPRATGLR